MFCEDCYEVYCLDNDYDPVDDKGDSSDYTLAPETTDKTDTGKVTEDSDYNNDYYDDYNTCLYCGAYIDSGSSYCDDCLGYGTCQDCGATIDSDRFYCDSRLYDYKK